MTIAMGFNCTDGVVLCADSQMTIPSYLKYMETKIWTFHPLVNRPFFAYSGEDINFSKMSIERLARRLYRCKGVNELSALRAEALRIHDEYYHRYKKPEEKGKILWSLVAIQHQKTVSLFHADDISVVPVVKPFECIGAGMFLAESLAALLYPKRMTVQEASFVGAYILGQVKKRVDGCGEQSQILTIWPRVVAQQRPEVSYDVMHPSTIERLEKGYENIQGALLPLMTHIDSNPLGRSDPILKAKITTFARVIRKEAKLRGFHMGVHAQQAFEQYEEELGNEND